MTDADVLDELIATAVAAAVEPLLTRIAVLEKRQPLNGRDGLPGVPGVSGRDGEKGIAGERGERGPEGPQGPEGPAGKDAPLPDLDEIALRVASLIPAPKDGTNGIDGQDGAQGPEGRQGERGPEGPQGQVGDKGVDGKDGLGLAGAVLTKDGVLVLTLSDGSVRELGIVKGDPGPAGRDGTNGRDGLPGAQGRSGSDGRDGLDGLGFDDIHVDYDGERTFTFKFARGGREKTFGAFRVPSMIHRGVWLEGKAYEQGDVVTWAGSGWIAKTDTITKPGDGSSDWLLVIKRGRDGRDAKEIKR
jgi:integrin beta 3